MASVFSLFLYISFVFPIFFFSLPQVWSGISAWGVAGVLVAGCDAAFCWHRHECHGTHPGLCIFHSFHSIIIRIACSRRRRVMSQAVHRVDWVRNAYYIVYVEAFAYIENYD